VSTTFCCEQCGHKHTITGASSKRQSSTVAFNASTFRSAAVQMMGESAASLERQPDPNYASRTVEAPARAASIESDVKVPLLQSLVGGAFIAGSTVSTWLYFGWHQPLLGPAIVTFGTIGFFWMNGVSELRSHLWRVEKIIGRDLNKDGAVGRPEAQTVYTPMPINMRDRAGADSTPAPEPAATPAPKPTPKTVQTTGDSLIQIRAADKRKSARIVTLGELWSFMTLSFERDSWGRDAWQERGMGQKVWADYKMFLESFGWWKVADRPTLDLALRRFCYPVTNEPGNERTNEGETS